MLHVNCLYLKIIYLNSGVSIQMLNGIFKQSVFLKKYVNGVFLYLFTKTLHKTILTSFLLTLACLLTKEIQVITYVHSLIFHRFGRATHDEETCIMPLLQCCVVRLSTFNRLYSFHVGPKHLSDIMRESMAKDPVAPVLIEPHLKALDRRVGKVLEVIRLCLASNSPDLVFLDDLK